MRKNWRVIVAVVVAFIVGGAAGALAEHAHVQSDKTDSSAAATTTTVPTADWFGTQKSAACPTLTKWYTAIGKVAYLAPGKGTWTTTRAQLLQQDSTISAAYQALLSNANALGQPEIQALAAYQGRVEGSTPECELGCRVLGVAQGLGLPTGDITTARGARADREELREGLATRPSSSPAWRSGRHGLQLQMAAGWVGSIDCSDTVRPARTTRV